MTTGNPNLDHKLEHPPQSPTPAEKARAEQEAQAKALAVDQEGPESDPRALLPGITTALEGLGMLTPNVGRVKIVFAFEPYLSDLEEVQWTVKASVEAHGKIKEHLDPKNPEVTLNVEVEALNAFDVSGLPHARIGDAVLSLQKKVEELVTSEVYLRREQTSKLDSVLGLMQQQANLSKVWPRSDDERHHPDDVPTTTEGL
jgi:hypothetical protein